MSEPTLTLPGTIPGLLRRGSPVTSRSRRGVVADVWDDDGYGVGWSAPDDGDADCFGTGADLSLDLTDTTGGTHALWWLDGHSWPEILDACAALEIETWQIGSAMEAVRHHPDGAGIGGGIGHHLDLLRRVILQIAGVDRG